MRINRIELENITSLRGVHDINFDKIGELSDLFAITGPTGSGKSTILTAISMALYGEHHKGINAADMVTMGESKGRIALSFEILGNKYHVEWMCQVLKKDGSPRKSPITTRVLYHNEMPIERSIEDLIGLSYSQFSKVVILNQGKFSEFLTSSFTQRKDLLEKLLEHHELKTISPYINKKIKDLKTELNNLDQQSENTLLLTEEELKEIKKKYEDNILVCKKKDEELLNLKQTIHNLNEFLTMAFKWHELQGRLTKETKEITELNTSLLLEKKNLKECKKKFEQSENKEKKLRPKLNRALKLYDTEKALNKEKGLRLKDIEENKKNKNALVKQSEVTNHDSEVIKTKLESFNNTNLKDQDPNTLETHINHLVKNNELKTEVDAQRKTVQIYLEEKKRLEEKANELKKTNQKINLWFNQLYPIELESSPDKLFLMISSTHQKATDNQNTINDNKKRKQKLIAELDVILEKKLTVTKELTLIRTTLLTLTEELPSLRTEKSSLSNELKYLELLDYSYKNFIKDNHKNCPICNSDIENEKVLEIKEQVESKEYVLKKSNLDDIELKIKRYESEISANNAQIIFLEERIADLKKEESKLNQDLSLIEEENTSLSKEIENNAQITPESYSKAQQDLFQFQNNIKEISSLRENWQSSQSKFNHNNDLLDKLLAQLDSIDRECEAILEIHQFKKDEDALTKLKKLQKDYQEYRLFESKLIGLENLMKGQKQQLLDFQSKIDSLSKQIKEIDSEIIALQNEFQIEELPLNPLEVEEEIKSELLANKLIFEKSSVQTQEKEILYEKKQSQINILKEQENGIKDLITNYLSNLDKSLNHDQMIAGDDLERLKKIRITDFKAIEEMNSLSEFFHQKLTPFFEDATAKNKERSDAQIVLKTQIEENNKQQSKLSIILEKKSKLKEKLANYEFLAPYLLKDSFRDYALAVLEESLLEMANIEIDSLADGRYLLIHGKAGKRSELLVKDLWQGNSIRKVSTLSGGETFLLSLGLALGLSEITRGQTEIESFFIDEGFGTLDEESTSQVLNCLMQMQSRGKQIGLISHVKALTDQIPVRVELEKNNFGESHIGVN